MAGETELEVEVVAEVGGVLQVKVTDMDNNDVVSLLLEAGLGLPTTTAEQSQAPALS